MEPKLPQTEFVRQALARRPDGPDAAYESDLLELERLVSTRPLGLASAMNLSNLISRYPREADGIVRELGIRPFEPLEDERLRMLMDERLRLAEMRHRFGRFAATELGSLFEY